MSGGRNLNLLSYAIKQHKDSFISLNEKLIVSFEY